MLADEPECLAAITGLGHDDDLRVFFQELTDAFADDRWSSASSTRIRRFIYLLQNGNRRDYCVRAGIKRDISSPCTTMKNCIMPPKSLSRNDTPAGARAGQMARDKRAWPACVQPFGNWSASCISDTLSAQYGYVKHRPRPEDELGQRREVQQCRSQNLFC